MERVYPLLFVFLWSTGFVGAKYGLPYAEPLSFLLTRYGLVIALMTAIALATGAPWPKRRRDWLHIGISGVLVHAIYLGGVFVAIKHGLSAGITALVVGMQPLLTGLLSGSMLGEKVSTRQWGGLGRGFIGIALVVSGKLGDGALGPMLIPALVALLGITAGTLYQKRFCPKFDLRSGSVIQTPSSVWSVPRMTDNLTRPAPHDRRSGQLTMRCCSERVAECALRAQFHASAAAERQR